MLYCGNESSKAEQLCTVNPEKDALDIVHNFEVFLSAITVYFISGY